MQPTAAPALARRFRRSVAGSFLGVSFVFVVAACSPSAPTSAPAIPSPSGQSAVPSASPSVSPSVSESTSSPSESPSAPASASATAAVTALCRPSVLSARVTRWEGAAGHRIAHVTLTNKGSEACVVHAMAQPQLVDGIGSIVINGGAAGSSASLVVDPGGSLSTLVQDGDYCKATPVPPVTVAFVLGGGAGRIVATPLAPNDVSGVPPCLGAPGTAGDIEMRPWAP